ncbi:hypothetical protein GMDG_04143 [Pseudogymnoascus destructans 20631-21]|uniref:ATP-dependent DNA helicase n=1 Tax=Pseudogymnoascus destructans (strain ATCC MYA-4855 / 20631-21) TaxID=658429 RepID=L8G9B7_PSED2|nr:hypothetical protein GMDG_04143 [Pseudogymnoascus destructans 20631-21]
MATNYSGFDADKELEGLPSDAFSSSPEPDARPATPQSPPESQLLPRQRVVAPLMGLRQTTLFGGRAADNPLPASQVNKVHSYRVDLPPEAPTHHSLDIEALKTWVYPTNLGAIRDYQYSITKNGLFNNTLVALPTGLGKTFIAATIMLNYYRWTKDSQIVFMAPTKPLVAQQVDACFYIAGIPRSSTTMLTGEISPALRAEEWASKRVFFMTPQTLENDLRTGLADPKKIVLLVVDEAHRATGNYSYVKVIEFMRRFTKSFRILALTATPGSSVEAVQEVINGLEISKVEIRTEESIDIQQYVHQRNIDQVILDPSEEIVKVQDLLSRTLKPLVDQLCGHNAYYNRDPLSLTPFGMLKAQETWLKSPAGKSANFGLKGMMRSLFTVLAGVSHGIKLLNFHGVGPFFQTMKDFRSEAEERGAKPGKYKKQIMDSPHFKKMMDLVNMWINKDDFVGHPKLTYLCDTVLNHFLDAGDGRREDGAPPSTTRIIVFCEYRGSAEEVARVLNRHAPMVRASVFVGQAGTKHSDGMNQAMQIETIRKFKEGIFNVIVATSIGEEGLDIGQVDLIVCYDASSSPIRMLQRMGRTGRKRAGNIVLLLMRGKEEDSFIKAKDNYEAMQRMISDGSRFNFRFDLSTRIVPRDIVPAVDKRDIEIPVENTQDPSLPEPKRRAKRAPKRPPKKFNMPDDVGTGFQSVAAMMSGKKTSRKSSSLAQAVEEVVSELSEDQRMEKPLLESVFLSHSDKVLLLETYQTIAGGFETLDVSVPELNKHIELQRSLRPTERVKHGAASKRLVKMLQSMQDINDETLGRWERVQDDPLPLRSSQNSIDLSTSQSSAAPPDLFSLSAEESETLTPPRRNRAAPRPKHRSNARSPLVDSITTLSSSSAAPRYDDDEEDSDLDDFIVRDDETPKAHSAREQQTIFSSVSPLAKARPFFEPTQFTATQESMDGDEELPDISTLVGKWGRSAGRPVEVRDEGVGEEEEEEGGGG